VLSAYMKELELQLVLPSPDEAALQHRRANQRFAVECSVERSAAIEAIQQDRTVAFGLARWPALYVVVLRPEDELVVLVAVYTVDQLRAVYRPELTDLVPLELPDLHVQSSLAIAG
jgi:hypothetical protein